TSLYTLSLHDALPIWQVARSRDVGTAVGVLACLQLALWLMPGWLDDFRRLFALAMPGPGGLDDAASQLFPATLMLLAKMLLPLRSEEHTSELQSRENL